MDGYSEYSDWKFKVINDKDLNDIKVLTNETNIHNNIFPKRVGSIIFINKRDYYDFELDIGVSHITYSNNNSSAGLLFRYIDNYNYYGVNISNRSLKLFKFTNGVYQEIENLDILNIFDNRNYVYLKIVSKLNKNQI